jgi:hypothetical protein
MNELLQSILPLAAAAWGSFRDLVRGIAADPTGLWILIGTAVVLGLLIAWWIARTIRRLRAWWFRRLGSRGEDIARTLLTKAGYAIVDDQSHLDCSYQVDDETITYKVRADFIVEKDGLRFVAEAKNGDVASDPRCTATRRQLREYSAVFQADGVLLVDVPDRRIRRVVFSGT